MRAANDVGRCASRGSTAAALSGAAPCSVTETSRSTTPSMSKAADKIIAVWRAGISFCSRDKPRATKRKTTTPSAVIAGLDPAIHQAILQGTKRRSELLIP